MKDFVVGIDIGGSHITVALIDMGLKSIMTQTLVRRQVDRHGTSEAILRTWSTAILHCLEKGKHQDSDLEKTVMGGVKLGIAMPGPFEYDSGISRIKGFDKYDSLYGLNVKELLAERVDTLPSRIRLKNDASCFLDGELFAGAATNEEEVLGITLGTGFGTAFGRSGTAIDAELSQTSFLDGRAEDYFSTKWFMQEARVNGGVVINGVMDLLQPDMLQLSRMIFDKFSSHFALFFENYLQDYPFPECVVIGGNIAQAHVYFLKPLKDKLKAMGIELNIKLAVLGESAALLGAASLWQHESNLAHR